MVNMDDFKNVECYRRLKNLANKRPEAKPKDSNRTFKVQKVEEPVTEDPKSIRQIRILISALSVENNDSFIRY